MLMIQDGLKRTLSFEKTPSRVISLVPSLTETLFDLGLEASIVGRTKFCIHPKPQIETVPVVGGTKKVRFEKIRALKPNLIIANKEENTKRDIEQLLTEYSIYISDIRSFEDLKKFIHDMASIFEVQSIANKMLDKIEQYPDFEPAVKKKVVYIIWQKPIMTVGNDTFIHFMLNKSGFRNAFEQKMRYPIITKEDIIKADPDCIFLSSEPFPFTEKHVRKFERVFPNIQIKMVDGEMFSWYGTRVLQTIPYFKKLHLQCR